MKNFTIVIILFFAFINILNSNPLIDSLIVKNYRIRGSEEAYKNVKSIEAKYTTKVDATSIKGKFYQITPDKIRLEASALENNSTIVINNKEGYITNGKDVVHIKPEKIEEAKKSIISEEMLYEPAFFDSKEKGYKIEFAGKETLDEGECDILKLTDKDKKVIFVYFLENGLDVKYRFNQETGKGEKEFEIFLKENKKSGAFFIPHLIEMKIDGEDYLTKKFDYIIYNGKIKDELFNILPKTK